MDKQTKILNEKAVQATYESKKSQLVAVFRERLAILKAKYEVISPEEQLSVKNQLKQISGENKTRSEAIVEVKKLKDELDKQLTKLEKEKDQKLTNIELQCKKDDLESDRRQSILEKKTIALTKIDELDKKAAGLFNEANVLYEEMRVAKTKADRQLSKIEEKYKAIFETICEKYKDDPKFKAPRYIFDENVIQRSKNSELMNDTENKDDNVVVTSILQSDLAHEARLTTLEDYIKEELDLKAKAEKMEIINPLNVINAPKLEQCDQIEDQLDQLSREKSEVKTQCLKEVKQIVKQMDEEAKLNKVELSRYKETDKKGAISLNVTESKGKRYVKPEKEKSALRRKIEATSIYKKLVAFSEKRTAAKIERQNNKAQELIRQEAEIKNMLNSQLEGKRSLSDELEDLAI